MSFMGRSRIGTMILLALLFVVPAAYPCTWSVGYFHQVTRLRGTVVGVKDGDLRHPFRLLRLLVSVGQAKLMLYDYPYQWADGAQHRIVKQVVADDEGKFDFGTIPAGHYTLLIDRPWGKDSFNVQVMQLPKPTASVRIDVSPNYPDCTGGHEFIRVSEK